MGFLSKLFSKKETSSNVEVKVTVTTKVNNEPYNPDVPPLQGEYAKTIFLWAHEKASPVRKNDEYARYFLYECGVKNPSSYHKELIADGYFENAPIAAILSSLKVTDLKQFLTSIGQVSTGKKDILIERIIQNADESTLNRLCPDELYVLSEKVKRSLKNITNMFWYTSTKTRELIGKNTMQIVALAIPFMTLFGEFSISALF